MTAPATPPAAARVFEATPSPSGPSSPPSPAFLARIPRDFARRHLLVSRGGDETVEHLLVAPSTAAAAILNTGARLGRTPVPVTGEAETIARLIDEAYGSPDARRAGGAHDDLPEGESPDEVDRLLDEADQDLLSTQGKGPVVRLVDALLFESLGRGASDVHLQPLADRTLVRERLDGVMHTVREIPRHATAAIVSRLKVMGRMDIAERRLPQDGRASVTLGDRHVDLRLSTWPTRHGERAVVRLLDEARQLATPEALGLPPSVAGPFLDRATRAGGIILLTGPTGSGKTTTLYATLRHLGVAAGAAGDSRNIMTIEDPIEYELSGAGLAISQSQVNERKGITFATGLRHLLRQDPDVIMVGEIRDAQTARMAIQASLTGHLVFSTLHTNDAAGAVTRLLDLGLEPYLVAASLAAVLAQRLVRLVHRPCAGRGCAECHGTGFRGRRGLFELLVVDETVRQLIATGATGAAVRDAAARRGLVSLAAHGRRLVADGLTTEAEVRRVLEDAA